MGDYDWLIAFLELKDEILRIAQQFKSGELDEEHGYPLVDAAVKKYYDRWVKPFEGEEK